MSKQLYEEALADLKKVKEIAEDNAKRAIIEAVAPRIKELIEKELLGESSDLEEEKGESEDPKLSGGKEVLTGSPEENKNEVEEDVYESFSLAGLVDQIDSFKKISNIDEMNQRLTYIEKLVQNLSNVNESKKDTSGLKQISGLIDSVYDYLQESVDDPNSRLGYGLRLKKCLEKIEIFQEKKMRKNINEAKINIELDLPNQEDDIELDGAVATVIMGEDEEDDEQAGESDEEGGDDDAEDIFGEPEDESEESKEGDLLEMVDEDTVVEIDENMLRREIAFMKLLREADESEKAGDVDGHGVGPDEFDDFGGAHDEGEPLDMDITEAYGLDEDDMLEIVDDDHGPRRAKTQAKIESDAHDDPSGAKTQAKIKSNAHDDPSGAKTQAKIENRMKKAADPSSVDEDDSGAASQMSEYDSGTDDLDEMYVDEADDVVEYGGNYVAGGVQSGQSRQLANESVRSAMTKELKLQESLRTRASQLKKLYDQTKKVKTLDESKKVAPRAAEIKSAYAETATRYNKSVERFNKLSRSLNEGAVKNSDRSNRITRSGAQTDQVSTLSKKLAETNLFNAKLLFTNKLLQTESLTARQKAQVIEQLDAAETIREAKLVYESLAKALVKPRKTVTEGRVFGSSSQTTRSASTQTISEGVEAERWARLAGIK